MKSSITQIKKPSWNLDNRMEWVENWISRVEHKAEELDQPKTS
jgi:hypothetical protein